MTLERTITFGQSTQLLVKSSRAPISDVLAHAAPYDRTFIISDETVAGLYGDELLAAFAAKGLKARLLTFPPGETSKTLHRVVELTGELLSMGAGKTDLIIGFGGGVTTDLAGFAASLVKRGIPWLALPTTFLGAVDASIGGKTGVNTEHGKNLVGTFFPPFATIISTLYFDTLSDDDLRSGWVECLKTALIGSAELVDAIGALFGPEALGGRPPVVPHEILWAAARIKMELVKADPLDQGVRSRLNLGHTVGHAVEMASGGVLTHGQAVAVGMVREGAMAVRMGLQEPSVARRVEGILSAMGLDTSCPWTLQELMPWLLQDKKNRGPLVGFSLLLAPGRMADLRHLCEEEIVRWWS